MRDLINIVEAASDPILDHLKQRYVEWNDLYFNGELPPVPMRWGALKNSGAQVQAKSIGIKGGAVRYMDGSMVMVFSSKYKRTAEELEPLLLHEMVHVYVIGVLGDIKEHHGPKFAKALRELEAKCKRDIPITDNTKGLELSDDTIKPYGVVIERYRSQTAYALLSPNVLRDKLETLVEYYKKRPHVDIEIRIVSSKLWTEKAARTTVQRNAVGGKLKMFIPKPEELEDLMANSKLLWETKPTT